MMRPVLEYGSTIWDPHTDLNINSLESIMYKDLLQDSVTMTIVSKMLNQLELANYFTTKKKEK